MENTTNAKQTIVNNAVALMKNKGYDNVSIVDICRDTGITRTTFYYHFQGKEDIIESYFQSRLESSESMFSELMKEDNDLDRFYVVIEKLISVFVEEGPEFGRQVLHSILNNNHTMASYFLKEDWCVPLLTNCQKNDLVRKDLSPEELDQLIVSQALGLSFQWCASGGSFDLLSRIRTAVGTILNG